MAGAPTLQQSSVESQPTESEDFSDLPPLLCLQCNKFASNGVLDGIYYVKECKCEDVSSEIP